MHERVCAGKPETIETEIVGLRGGRWWIELRAVPLDRSSASSPAYLAVARDISGRKRMAELLRGSTEFGIITIDANYRVVLFNASAERLFRCSAAEMVGRTIERPRHDEDLRRFCGTETRAMGTFRPIIGLRADGDEFPIQAALSQMETNGLKFFTVTLRDVTDSARAEAAKQRLEEQLRQSQKMEAIGQLAGGVAHDFNNLMTIILGQCESLLANLPEDHPIRHPAAMIYHAGERAASLTRQLLAFSRQTVLEAKVLDLNTVVTDAERLLRRLIGEDIQLTVQLDPRVGRVKADPDQLQQVVVNLALNSRDAMPDGGKLTIETGTVELNIADADPQQAGFGQRHFVMLKVSDTGCGMTRDERSHIFEPFYTTKSQGKGTGLGLSVVHGIIKQSGGQIEVDSGVGAGTTFKILLPETDEAGPSEIRETDHATIQGGTETLLIVEDEDAVREISTVCLESLGYKVLAAASDREAVRIAENHRGQIDMLVSDVVLPGMNGRQLANTLRDRMQNLKVLFISGYTADIVLRRGVLEGEVDFLEKPFTPSLLASRIRVVLDRH
jgi:PAS domain S-box-containing protein